MSNIDAEKLLSEIEDNFIQNYDFPPLTARIFVYMITDVDENGVSFDELVEHFGASKSSISCSLKFLIETDKVDFIYKEDKRKRYFRPNPYYFSNHLREVLEQVEKTIISLDKIELYKQRKGITKLKNEEALAIIKNYMHQQRILVNDTIEQLNKYKI
ncbi:hypothetical protein [Vaginella massiliensis]|uniref:hypothetical protein n=1 Tax=Vaginella massiliensis TaxID=1816680 RepID=UPI000838076C|nr:hypothetical protein [Vaginella massiliensis]